MAKARHSDRPQQPQRPLRGQRPLQAQRRRAAVEHLLLPLALAGLGFGCQSAPPAEDEPAKAEKPDAPDSGKDAGASEGAGAAKAPGAAKDVAGAAEAAAAAPKPAGGPDGAAGAPVPVPAPGGIRGQVKLSDMQADRDLAEHYFRVGQRFFQELEYQKAYDNLAKAVSLDPSHQDALVLYRRAGEALGLRQEELQTNLERFTREQKIKLQLLRQEMLNFFEAGEKAFAANDFAQSIKDFERVTQIIAFSEYEIDPGAGPSGYKARATSYLAEAKQRRLRAEIEERDRKEQEMARLSLDEERRREEQRDIKVKRMLDQTTDLLYAHRYEQAKELAETVLGIEPGNRIAEKLRQYAVDGIHWQRNKRIHENLEEEIEATWREVETAAVPQEFDYIRYPDDWKERTKNRKPGIGEVSAEEPAWVRNTKKILRDREVTLNFNGVGLQDVVLFLADITQLNFVIAAEVEADSITVTLQLKEIKLENALKIILEQVGLEYTFDKEAIMIVNPGSKAGAPPIFDIYDVSDLLFQFKDFKAPRMSLPDPDNTQGQGGGGGGSLIFGGEEEDTGEAITGEKLAEIIVGATGGDEVWSEPNGIEPHKGQLLVTGPKDLHERVIEVIEKIRRNQGWFVHIEVRFIEMTNDTLEDFGVDFRGLGGNPGDETLVRGAANPNPILATGPTNQIGTPVDLFTVAGGRNVGGTDAGVLRDDDNPAGGFGRNFGPGLRNVAMRTQHVFGNAFGPVFGNQRLQGGSGLSLQVAKLDPFQVNAIIRAEWQEQRSSQVTAPRITAANREKVYVSVVTQRAYISDWDLISGGTGLTVIEVPDPIIETLQEGVVLEVRPTISADRKYVTLDCRPSLATLVGGQINTVIVNLGAVSMAAIAVPIGVPEITLQEAFTSVTIPDGGTALLGGFRQIQEQKETSSMPFVDNVPLLNVLFRRKGHVKEQTSLVILVTAKVMNIRDEERRRFNTSE